jgi:hypothetical protein
MYWMTWEAITGKDNAFHAEWNDEDAKNTKQVWLKGKFKTPTPATGRYTTRR